MLAKKMPECIEAQRQKKWRNLQPIEVEGKTVGIVGLGTVGDELARKAKALGMRVLATKRTAAVKPDYVDELGTPEFLPGLLAASEYSSFCLPPCRKLSTSSAIKVRCWKRAYFINLTGAVP